ncbi:MAG: hypothetical protein RMJ66_08550, partial [Bacteroidia bacterium]|nr:hypothetical protein [Bacteroidia bacterium]MDW8135097.1 hypothetical protein [Bacteroidia bacterium]
EAFWFLRAWSERQWKSYVVQLLVLITTSGLGVLSQISSLLPYYEYGKYSIRGGSELEREVEKLPSLRTGLDREYAQSYSAARAEVWTLIIPDFVGGTSQEDLTRRLGKNSALYTALRSQGVEALQILRAVPTYWGGSPFSAGSFYVGVVWFLLALLGWLYKVDKMDWILIYATWISILLCLGAYGYSLWASLILLVLPGLAYWGGRRLSHPLWRAVVSAGIFLGGWGAISLIDDDPANSYKLTDWVLDYFPFYNKFRAPSTWLVVMGFLFPWMGLRGIVRFLENPQLKMVGYAAAIGGGILVVVGWGAPWIGFSFEGAGDAELQRQGLPAWFMDALREDRIQIARQSTLRSLLWLGMGSLVLFLFVRRYINLTVGGVGLACIALLDGWLLNAAYFPRKEIYVREREIVMPPPKEPYEEFILADTLRPFRVLPFHTNPFTDARPGVYLENAGGYHPAKIKRYQQLIETHLSRLQPEVLKMLSIRYVTARPGTPAPTGYDSIAQTADGVVIFRSANPTPIAWLSPFVKVFPRVDQTLDSLGKYPAHKVALVAEKDWRNLSLLPSQAELDSVEGVVCISREFDKIVYEVRASRPRLLVCSEVYYPPDWKASIDDKETKIIPVNFVLRGVVVPEGKHKVYLECKSLMHEKGKQLSLLGSVGAWTLIVIVGILSLWRRL